MANKQRTKIQKKPHKFSNIARRARLQEIKAFPLNVSRAALLPSHEFEKIPPRRRSLITSCDAIPKQTFTDKHFSLVHTRSLARPPFSTFFFFFDVIVRSESGNATRLDRNRWFYSWNVKTIVNCYGNSQALVPSKSMVIMEMTVNLIQFIIALDRKQAEFFPLFH